MSGMNICPQCGTNNRPGVLVCPECGASIFATTFGQTQVVEEVDDFPEVTIVPRKTTRLDPGRRLVIQVMGGPVFLAELDEVKVLGRADSRNPHLPDIDLTRFEAFKRGVSCRHALIRRQDDQLQVADLGSTNGTYLNERRLIPHEPYAMKVGDYLRLAHLMLKLCYEDEIA